MSKKTKKYQLHNSYFKVNRMQNLPDSILDIAKYEKEHGELPFAYSGKNWLYDAFCERQNPPYETPILTEVLEWIYSVQDYDGLSILLLPKGFLNKEKPKRTQEAISNYEILEVRDMTEDFARTKTQAEIVVLKKLYQ